ncbi:MULTISPECIES: hypothetical protein [Clostridium]|jgi:hypothetical protein|uniref:Uncharacterized protein n=2 Tax=Clostridium TaxID=1485 RepID=D8GJM7_CLOLD|nr:MULTISPECIES: hypothetical protein [Clostridium]ADK15188.1 hypothetical protein CLJU_c21280 [Clostridium ljungdahlii DSM 13528]AGY74447.1 hypothetical protein CAETHG_0214 [Clostridium autoethanogenum DSM 10061]ALU34635.1 Hypothetical protein CLAU_0206 [Clostridium autoethanogenum DSM 10061]OAA88668.1 hypothetical protein WX45_02602 [Clostridium ljungdahlii DSM 13528]OVY51355.1 hypothetical protein WX72_01487 [Clostridium autoethanogenum]
MYDIKDFEKLQERKNKLRADCIGDRGYFRSTYYESMFQFKSMHIPTESLIK